MTVVTTSEDVLKELGECKCGCGETHSVSCEVPYCWKCGAKMDEEVDDG